MESAAWWAFWAVGTMAAAIGLAEQGKRKNGRWERNSLDIGTGADIAARTIHLAGVVLDYDADRGTEFADRVLTGALTLKEAHRLVMGARHTERAMGAEQPGP